MQEDCFMEMRDKMTESWLRDNEEAAQKSVIFALEGIGSID